jgi:hypothetical protein
VTVYDALDKIAKYASDTYKDLADALSRAYKTTPGKLALIGGGIGAGSALAGLGVGEAIHDLQIANYGGQPLNPYQYFSPVPYSPYAGYSPYSYGLGQSFTTIFNPFTILLIVLVIIVILFVVLIAKA